MDEKLTIEQTLAALERCAAISDCAVVATRALAQMAADPKVPDKLRLAAAKGLVERVPQEVWTVIAKQVNKPAAEAATPKE